MIKEYYNFIKEYLKLANTKKSYFYLMILTSLGYKGFLLLNTLFASLIIKYATNNNLKMTYISIILLTISFMLLSYANKYFLHLIL